MDKDWQDGDWLLLDAAGPDLVVGVLRDGQWHHYAKHAEGFLESLQHGVKASLDYSELRLASLRGLLFATGPGSTLGLRLAAMFARTLLQLPVHAHWRCFTYNNLELACAASLDPDSGPFEIAAPWRKDRLHRATYQPGPPKSIQLDIVDLKDPSPPPNLHVVALGNRTSVLPVGSVSVPYPAERIPDVLAHWPTLLKDKPQPDLYVAEDPEFARWTCARHPSK